MASKLSFFERSSLYPHTQVPLFQEVRYEQDDGSSKSYYRFGETEKELSREEFLVKGAQIAGVRVQDFYRSEALQRSLLSPEPYQPPEQPQEKQQRQPQLQQRTQPLFLVGQIERDPDTPKEHPAPAPPDAPSGRALLARQQLPSYHEHDHKQPER